MGDVNGVGLLVNDQHPCGALTKHMNEMWAATRLHLGQDFTQMTIYLVLPFFFSLPVMRNRDTPPGPPRTYELTYT